MRRLGVAGLCGLAALVWAGPRAAADLIRLRNGNELEGRVLETTERAVIVDVPGVGQVTLQPHEIVAVESRPMAPVEAPIAAAPAAEPPSQSRPPRKKSSAKTSSVTPTQAPRAIVAWPPRLDQPYPDLTLPDDRGNPFRLSSLKGKIILLQPVDMRNPACQALSGAHRRDIGPYGAVTPQKGLESIAEYLQSYASVQLPHPRVYHVQVLMVNREGALPSVDEGRDWERHFQLAAGNHQLVLIGDEALFRAGWWQGAPGAQLIDQDFILRIDSTGAQPQHNLLFRLFPAVRQALGADVRAWWKER